ncbi:MAG: ribosome silencing factor [Campylobacterales bacterium]
MRRRVRKVITLLSNKKAEDIIAFDLEKSDYFVEHVIIASSLGKRHTHSLLDDLKQRLKSDGEEFLHIDEGEDWIVADLGDILVHIMSQEKREYFRIEEFLNSIDRVKSEKIEK